MIKIILICVLIFFIFSSITFRFVLTHPFVIIKNAVLDIYDYIKHKKSNECKLYGKVLMYTAQDSQAFGCGKSLSMVNMCNFIDKTYNKKPVWDYEEKKFVNQNIFFVSNLELKNVANYVPFTSKEQFKNVDKMGIGKHDVVFFVLDEAGIVFNSRQYKDNMPTEFIQKLLQVRHYKIGFITNAQRFAMVDKVFREICNTVQTCKKFWRFVWLNTYDAYELENAVNPSLLMPIKRKVWFATNEDFNSYDTNYNIDTLRNDLENGDLLTTEEILASRGESNSDLDTVVRLKKRFRLRKNK